MKAGCPLALMAALMLLPSVGAQAQPQSCAADIRAVLDDIAARDLDTADGPPRNAFLALNPAAIAQAEALDRAAASGQPKGPLFCMPVAVKDNFETADMPMTAGSLALAGNDAPRDAPLVARLRKAGAVVVGKTNMDEFAMGIRGLSGAGGRVGNAYDPRQSSGGSSAGSGVAVGLGFVPLAVGSDNCGSLRIPAVYNGAVSLRPSYALFESEGVFPIGFVNGVTGLIAKDTTVLKQGLAVVGADWQTARADAASALKDKRLGLVRSLKGKDLWSPADAATRKRFDDALALMRAEGATIVEMDLDGFESRLGPEFFQGFGPRVDAMLARYPGPRRTWRDVCTSGRLMPEWTERECRAHARPQPTIERRAAVQIERNQKYLAAVLDRMQLDAVIYPVDGRGGARPDVSGDITCMIAGGSRLPAVAFPVGLDDRGLPVGLEFLGRDRSDEMLVALMAHFEAARGPLPPPRRPAGRPELAGLSIPEQNNLRLMLGWRAFQSRKGKALGALEPEAFRALTDETIRGWRR